MRTNLPWAAFAALLVSGSAEGKALKWGDDSPSWVPAKETEAPKQPGFIPAAPQPTYMPGVDFDLMRRQTGSGNNTCGYINGVFNSASAIVCSSGWECFPSTALKVMGCCSNNNCVAQTQCWNSAQSKSFTGDDGGRVKFCSNSRSPYCAVGRYTSGTYRSYSIYKCDANPSRTYSLSYFSPTKAATSRSSARSSKSSSIPTSSTTTTSTPPASQTQTQTSAPASSPPPAGAIAGGVVGGIAAIGLIVLGAIFLWRRKSRDDKPPTAGGILPGSSAYAAVSQYPPPQEDRTGLMQPPYRESGSVSPYDPSVISSGLGSPSPGYQPYSNLPPSPQPPSTPFLQHAHYEPQPYQYHQPPPLQPQPKPQIKPYRPQQNVAELPTGRGDGELRELA